MKLISIFILFAFFFALAGQTDACTIVTAADGKNILAGNNEDNKDPNSKIWFIPAARGEHGRICWGFDPELKIAEGGMNDQGLFIDANGLAETRWQADPGKPTLPGSILDYILARCATVDEVIELFKKNNAMQLGHVKYPVADARGDAVVIEWGRGKLQFLKRNGRYLISTNFVQSNFDPSDYPCDRYKTADQILGSSKEVSIDRIRAVLAATCGGLTIATIYSTICDLKHGKVYLYNFHYFEEVVVFDLAEEMKKGRHGLDIPSLFQVKTHAAVLFDKIRIKSGKEELLKIINDKGVAAAIEQFYKFKEDQFQKIPKIDIQWGEIDSLGYLLLDEGRRSEAIAIFKLNVSENPDLWAVYDSLGEAYLKNGDIELAIENYKRSLELNSQNTNAMEILKKIGKAY